MTDVASISEWASIRLAVGSALFITYFVFAVAYWYALIKQEEKATVYLNMNDLASKMYLYGLGCLMSLNYYQSSIYMAIFSYFVMCSLIALIVMNVMCAIQESTRTKMYLLFYFLLFMWYMGIMIDFYQTWKDVSTS